MAGGNKKILLQIIAAGFFKSPPTLRFGRAGLTLPLID